MAQSAINQTISLSGDAEVKAKLAEVGAAGERAAAQLGAAGAGASGGLAQLSSAIGGVGAKFTEAGAAMTPVVDKLASLGGGGGPLGFISELTSIFGGLTTAVAAAGIGLAAFADNAANATHATENQARTLGLSVEQFEGLKFAAGQVGVAADKSTMLFDRFATKMGQAREAAEKLAAAHQAHLPTLDQLATKHEALARAVDHAALAAEKAATAVMTISTALRGAGTSVEHAEAAYKKLRKELGSPLGDTHEQAMRRKDAQDAVTSAHERQVEARRRQKEAIEAQRLAEEKLMEVERKRNNALRDEMVKKNAPDETPDNNKAIVEGVASAGSGGSGDLVNQLGAFADKFKSLTDATKQADLARSVFGRGWAEIAPLLNLGSEGIRRLSEEMKALQVTPTGAETKWASEFFAAAQKLETVLEGLKNAIGNIVGTMFTPMFTAMADGLAANAQNIREFAQTFVTAITPAVQGVSAAFGLFFASLGQIFGLISDILKRFGVDFSTSSVAAVASATAIVLVLGRLLGIFGLVSQAVGLLQFAFAGLSIVSAPLIALIAVIALVAAAVLLLIGPVDQVSAVIRKVFGDDAANAFDAFTNSFKKAVDDWTATFNGSVQGLVDIWNNGWNLIGDKLQAFADTFKGTVQGLVDIWTNFWTGVKEKAAEAVAAAASATPAAAGFAAGGQVHGPGGHDRVPIMASAGEFVHRVAAVQHYGSGFMHRVNSLQLPKFELGGLVGAFHDMIPAPQHFATGGMVTAGASANAPERRVAIDLTMNGQTFPVMAPREVADKLLDHARSQLVQRAGRMPGWAGGARGA